VDALRFQRLAGERGPEAWQEAVDCYRGDLLEGLTLSAPLFEEWLLSERERLREIGVDTLARLLAFQTTSADRPDALEAAARTARRLLALEPLQEAVHRALMQLYARLGRRSAGLKQYQICVSVLQRELGVEPEAATKEVYRGLLHQRPPDPGRRMIPAVVQSGERIAPTGRKIVNRESPLLGRRSELDELRKRLEGACEGRGHIVAVIGEAGIGKSTLLEALAAEALQRGARVLAGRSYQIEQVLAYGPWLDVFRSAHVAADIDALEPLPAAWRAELARLLPEVGTPEPVPFVTGDNAGRLFESVRRLLALLGDRDPIVLMLDDLHWADEMSVRLLAFLARRIGDARLLVVLTAREEELPASALLNQVVNELAHEGRLAVLRLTPLERSETAALVRALARTGSDEAAIAKLEDHVWSLSQGNPFVVVEAMRALDQTTSRFSGGLPPRVRDVVAARLETLTPLSRNLLGVAAVIGRECDFAVLRRAGGLSDDEAAAAVEELVRRRVLNDVGDRFDFLHDRIREVAYSQLLAPRVKVTHARIAEAIEAVYADRLEDVCDQLAYHYGESGHASKAAEYLTRIAEKSAEAYAHEEAVATFRQALAHAEHLPAEERDRRLSNIVLRIAHSLYFLGRYREALDLLVEQQERVERLGDPALAGPYHFLIGRYCSLLGDRRLAAAHACRAADNATQCGDRGTLGRSQFLLASEGLWTGRSRAGAQHGREAIRLLEANGESWWAGTASWMVAMNCAFLGDWESAFAAQTYTETIGRSIGDDHLVTCAAWTRGWILASSGDLDRAVESCREALEHSRDHFNTSRALAVLGYAYAEKGDAAEAIPPLERALQLAGTSGVRQLQGLFMAWLANAYRLGGDVARARQSAMQSLEMATAVEFPFGVASAHRALGRIDLQCGDIARAGQELTTALEMFVAIDAAAEAERTRRCCADIARTS
jgi:tetratricopeptide (TPR) repeat protein